MSFRTGRKFENHVSDHYKLREISDAICWEHNKSVLRNAGFYGGEKDGYWIHKDGKLTHKDMLRKDIEYCLSLSFEPYEFERRLVTLGYVFSRDMNTCEPSVKAPTWKRAVRLSSVGYPKERINRTFQDNRFEDEVYYRQIAQPIYRKRQTPLYDLEQTIYRAPWMGACRRPFSSSWGSISASGSGRRKDKMQPFIQLREVIINAGIGKECDVRAAALAVG